MILWSIEGPWDHCEMNSYIQLPCCAVSLNPTVGVYISSTAGVYTSMHSTPPFAHP